MDSRLRFFNAVEYMIDNCLLSVGSKAGNQGLAAGPDDGMGCGSSIAVCPIWIKVIYEKQTRKG